MSSEGCRAAGSGRGFGSLGDSSRIVCTNAFRPCAAEGVGVFVPDKRLASALHPPQQPEEQGAGTPHSSAAQGRSPFAPANGQEGLQFSFLHHFVHNGSEMCQLHVCGRAGICCCSSSRAFSCGK